MQKFVFVGSCVMISGLLAGGCGQGGSVQDGGGSVTDAPATDGRPPPSTDDDGDSTSNTGSATSVDPGSTSQGSTDDGGPDDTGPINFDLGVPDAPPSTCGGDGEEKLSLSYIWIANSAQGTISKIDTTTMVEEGRYQAKPFDGDPSRTSVNLAGDVAVASRNGGISKFFAAQEDCVESNGQAGIQTSTGAADVLPWGTEECLAWYTDMTCNSQRPVAWTRGTFNEFTCEYEGMKLWTVCDDQVLLLNGETGAIEETVFLPGPPPFVYGGAADADGNFWGLDTNNFTLLRIDRLTLDHQSWPLPMPVGGYGITVDPVGRPWVCGGGTVSRFNLDTSTWDSSGMFPGIGGCMTDGADLIWHSDDFGMLMGFNIETLLVDQHVQLPEYVHGVSVDFAGMVWGVSFAGSNAYRADPVTGTVDTYGGLIGAYTYSDMTGFALSTAGGGGVPQG